MSVKDYRLRVERASFLLEGHSTNGLSNEQKQTVGVILHGITTELHRRQVKVDGALVRCTEARFTTQGVLRLWFSALPEKEQNILEVAQAYLRTRFDDAMYSVRPYTYTATVRFDAVACRDDNGELLDADAYRLWLEHNPRWAAEKANVRHLLWGPKIAGATATLFVEIRDSVDGKRALSLHNESVPFRNGSKIGKLCLLKKITPRCTRCHGWGHIEKSCQSRVQRCSRCGDAHDDQHHAALAQCCKDNRGQPCTHPPKCVNCGKAHKATDGKCEFYVNRGNSAWMATRIAALANGRRAKGGSQPANTAGPSGSARQTVTSCRGRPEKHANASWFDRPSDLRAERMSPRRRFGDGRPRVSEYAPYETGTTCTPCAA